MGDGCQIAVSGKDAGIESQGCGTVIVTSGINTRIQSLGSRVQIGSSGEAVKIISSGEHAWIWSSGSDARISGEADFVQIRSSGEHVRIDNTGNFSRIISSGEDAWIKNSGYSCRMKSEGKRARITNFGENVWIECSGEGSIICGLGMGSFVKAARGSWITLAEWEYSREENRMILTQVKTGRVDNITLREGVYYTLKQGVFTEKKMGPWIPGCTGRRGTGMRYLVSQEIKSETKVGKSVYLFDLFFYGRLLQCLSGAFQCGACFPSCTLFNLLPGGCVLSDDEKPGKQAAAEL
ncbi:hypothetical protein [uncultured Merdimonas sp.]|uniref:hypothetical protein n=1 Tax=uncultured Merdimonas sp. TaxID=2023269 RepID=UPI0032091286